MLHGSQHVFALSEFFIMKDLIFKPIILQVEIDSWKLFHWSGTSFTRPPIYPNIIIGEKNLFLIHKKCHFITSYCNYDSHVIHPYEKSMLYVSSHIVWVLQFLHYFCGSYWYHFLGCSNWPVSYLKKINLPNKKNSSPLNTSGYYVSGTWPCQVYC